MTARLAVIPARGLRRFPTGKARTPWPFPIKRSGLRTLGPMYNEAWEWPMGAGDCGWSELHPQLRSYKWGTGWTRPEHPDYPELKNIENVQYPGYADPTTGAFVFVPEMRAEIVAPDLRDCKLKPYVSYRVHGEEKGTLSELEEQQAQRDEKGEFTEPSDRWPPPPASPELLFEANYKDQILQKFREGAYEDPDFALCRTADEDKS